MRIFCFFFFGFLFLSCNTEEDCSSWYGVYKGTKVCGLQENSLTFSVSKDNIAVFDIPTILLDSHRIVVNNCTVDGVYPGGGYLESAEGSLTGKTLDVTLNFADSTSCTWRGTGQW